MPPSFLCGNSGLGGERLLPSGGKRQSCDSADNLAHGLEFNCGKGLQTLEKQTKKIWTETVRFKDKSVLQSARRKH